MKELRIIHEGKAPSKSNSYSIRRGGRGVYVSQESRKRQEAWRKSVEGALPEGFRVWPVTKEVEIEIEWTVGDRRRRDVDNILKGLLDELEGLVFENDAQVSKITIERVYVKDEWRVDLVARLRA